MKQAIDTDTAADSLAHSMIDESTRKGWEYYAHHNEKRLNPDSPSLERETKRSDRRVAVTD